jgi:hypothetical protein
MAEPNLTAEQVQTLRDFSKKLGKAAEALAKSLQSKGAASGPVAHKPGGEKPAPKPVEAKPVAEAMQSVQVALDNFRNALPDPAQADTADKTRINALGTTADASTPSLQTAFTEFIGSVGRSVAQAQAALDQEARTELQKTAAGGGPLLPTLYRIPKLSAEVRFAFEKESATGLKMLFFSRKEKSSEEHQQSITFDIVATPPPSELVERLRSGAPAIRLVLDPGIRTRLFEAIRGGDLSNMDPRDKAILTEVIGTAPNPVPKDADRMLVIEAVPNRDQQYVLVLAAPDDKEHEPGHGHEIGIWHVQTNGGTSIKAALKFDQKNAPRSDQGPLRSLMAGLGNRQVEALASWNPARDNQGT